MLSHLYLALITESHAMLPMGSISDAGRSGSTGSPDCKGSYLSQFLLACPLHPPNGALGKDASNRTTLGNTNHCNKFHDWRCPYVLRCGGAGLCARMCATAALQRMLCCLYMCNGVHGNQLWLTLGACLGHLLELLDSFPAPPGAAGWLPSAFWSCWLASQHPPHFLPELPVSQGCL
eukprot:365654-Chlamydomonas_euryale.AAC.6